jgi:hypothetical protein
MAELQEALRLIAANTGQGFFAGPHGAALATSTSNHVRILEALEREIGD